MQDIWRNQVSNVMSSRYTDSRFHNRSYDTKTLIDRQSEFKPRPANGLEALYISNEEFLKDASRNPSLALQAGDQAHLEQVSNTEKSRFDSFMSRRKFMHSLRNSGEAYRPTSLGVH